MYSKMSKTEPSEHQFIPDEGIYISTEWGLFYGPFDSALDANEYIKEKTSIFDGQLSSLMVGMRFVNKDFDLHGRDGLEMSTISVKTVKDNESYLDFYE